MGRAGRSGEPSVCIFLHRQGERLPKEMRPFFKGGRAVCLRKALTVIFTLSYHDGKSLLLGAIVLIGMKYEL